MRKIIICVSILCFLLSCSRQKKSDSVGKSEDSICIRDSLATLEKEDKNRQDEESVIQISKGYSADPNYEPTISDKGKYHTIDGKANQVQYQGSAEQKRDLDMIDEYAKTHPDF